jgi:hypothetical protein
MMPPIINTTNTMHPPKKNPEGNSQKLRPKNGNFTHKNKDNRW